MHPTILFVNKVNYKYFLPTGVPVLIVQCNFKEMLCTDFHKYCQIYHYLEKNILKPELFVSRIGNVILNVI